MKKILITRWSKSTVALLLSGLVSPWTMAATLRIDNTGEPETLDPQMATGLRELRIDRELYEPLITYDAEGHLIPGLAQSWDTSADGLTWTFHLRDAKWSDGHPIMAEDAVFAFQRALLPSTHAQNAYLYYPIINAREVNTGKNTPDMLGIHALDMHTVQITLNAPLSYMTSVMADIALAPLPRHAIKTLDNTHWVRQQPLVVSGSYQLDHWTPQIEIVLKKNPAYYAADEVHIDGATFYPIENTTTALTRYRSGTLDISYSQLPSASYSWAREHLANALKTYPVLVHYVYLPNMRSGQPLADHRVREAMNLAIQRETITGKVIQSGQRPSYSAVPEVVTAPHAAPRFSFQAWSYEQRIERAKALMKAAGYSPEHPLDIELALNSVDDHRRIAIALAAMWKPIGIAPHFIVRDSSAHYSSIHHAQFQLARYGFVGMMMTPAEELGMYVSTASNNYAGYQNLHYDQKVAEGIHALTPEAARHAFDDAQQMLLDNMALIPILDQTQSLLVSPKVNGWQPNAVDVHPLRYLSITP